jgi:hypothetical protein
MPSNVSVPPETEYVHELALPELQVILTVEPLVVYVPVLSILQLSP